MWIGTANSLHRFNSYIIRVCDISCGFYTISLSASSSWLVDAAAPTEVILSTDVRFRSPWPYQYFCDYEAAGVASRPTPFLGHPHDLSNTRLFLPQQITYIFENQAKPVLTFAVHSSPAGISPIVFLKQTRVTRCQEFLL